MKIIQTLCCAVLACAHWAQQSSYQSLDHNNVACSLDDEGAFFSQLQAGLAGYESRKTVDLKPFLLGPIGLALKM